MRWVDVRLFARAMLAAATYGGCGGHVDAVRTDGGALGDDADTSSCTGECSHFALAERSPGRSVRVLASGHNSCGLIARAGYLYWADVTNGTIVRISTAGGPVATIASGQMLNNTCVVAVDATHVYWVIPQYRLMKASLAGGVAETIATGDFEGVVVGSNNVYYGTVPGDASNLVEVPKDGGTPTTLFSVPFDPTTKETVGVRPLAADATTLYFAWNRSYLNTSGTGATMKMAAGGGTPTLLLSDALSDLLVDETNLYFFGADSQSDGGALLRMSVDGGAPRTLVSRASGGALAMDSASFYWRSDGSELKKAPLAGGEVETIITSAGYPPWSGEYAIDDTGIYWATNGSPPTGKNGVVVKLTPK